MISINTARRLFVPQTASNDCGIACIAMLLNYTGQYLEANDMISSSRVDDNGLSLLQLKHIAASKKISGKCVSMDMDTLRDCKTPCILHVTKGREELHFVVCFSRRERSDKIYLIADPATGVSLLSAAKLEAMWKSKAALFVEDLPFVKAPLSKHPWFSLLKIRCLDKSLVIIVPFLNFCITTLGITLSWVLQRGLTDPLTNRSLPIIISLLLLLFIMTVCRGLIAFIKQKVLIKINSSINKELTGILNTRILQWRKDGKSSAPGYIRNALTDIQKIQNAVSTFIAVFLCEGSLTIIITLCLFYLQPACAYIVVLFLLITWSMAVRSSGRISFGNAQLRELSGRLENELDKEDVKNSGRNQDMITPHAEFLSSATNIATMISKLGLLYDCTSTCCIISVFAFCLYKLSMSLLSYESLMTIVILSYFITTLAIRMSNALIIVTEGTYLIRRYRY